MIFWYNYRNVTFIIHIILRIDKVPNFTISDSSLCPKKMLSQDWTQVKSFTSKNRVVQKNGKTYRIISKYERKFTAMERVCRICVGVAAVCFTLGTALFAKPVQNLFTKTKETRRFAVCLSKQAAPQKPKPKSDPNDLLIGFWSKDGNNTEGVTLKMMLSYSDEQLENKHNYIQWLFPSKEPSNYNTKAPCLTNPNLIREFSSNPTIQERIKNEVLPVMLSFWGFEIELGETAKITKKENFQKRWENVCNNSHNCLRITRAIKCLCEFVEEGKDIARTWVVELHAMVTWCCQCNKQGATILATSYNKYWKPIIEAACPKFTAPPLQQET